jgi:3-phenylpropionate/cinnamic acid dioxygenase small subunit
MTANAETAAVLGLSPEPLVPVEVEQRVRHFLHFESRLLDERRFLEWVNLFTDDAIYELPVRVNREDGAEGISRSKAFNDNKRTLTIRVERLQTEFAWSEQPPSRVRHYITNVMVAPAAEEDEFDAFSNELVYRSRGSSVDYDLLSAQRTDRLRVQDGRLRIAHRRVVLDQTALGAHNLSMFF